MSLRSSPKDVAWHLHALHTALGAASRMSFPAYLPEPEFVVQSNEHIGEQCAEKITPIEHAPSKRQAADEQVRVRMAEVTGAWRVDERHRS